MFLVLAPKYGDDSIKMDYILFSIASIVHLEPQLSVFALYLCVLVFPPF